MGRHAKIIFVFTAIMAAGLCCKAVKNEGADQKSVTDLCVAASEISGWAPANAACLGMTYDDLYKIMDGGADLYKAHGLIECTRQEFQGTSGKSADAYVMDMGTGENSAAMFNYKKNEASDKLAMSGINETDAIIGVFGSGTAFELYAHINRFYIWITFSGLENNSTASNTGYLYYQTYRSKL